MRLASYSALRTSARFTGRSRRKKGVAPGDLSFAGAIDLLDATLPKSPRMIRRRLRLSAFWGIAWRRLHGELVGIGVPVPR